MTTIYDIAKAAGVTATTVSYVLSGKGSISEATRARVLKYARELGYRPNLIARSLITRQTSTIGFLVPSIINPFYAEMAEAVERRAYAAGFRAFVSSTYEDEKLGQELLEDLASRRVDGIIVLPKGLSLQTIHLMASSGLPIVCCLWEEEDETIPSSVMSVGIDFAMGGQLVARHLLELGHQRIGAVIDGSPGGRVDNRLRFSGFRETLEQARYPLDPALLAWGNSSFESGKAAAQYLLACPIPPTAIFASNDLMAIGVIAAAWKLGIRVPQDLSVIGFDNIALTAYTTPPLTTVVIDTGTLIERAMSSLLNMIDNKHVESPPLLTPTLMTRQSTASPHNVVKTERLY